jgi:hypothetical protein
VFDVGLEGVGGTDRIPLDDAVEDVAMLVNNLHERPGSTRRRRTSHQDHVSERIDVVRKPAIARERQQGVVEAAVTSPHPLLIAGSRSPFHRVKCRAQQANAVFVKALDSPLAGRDLEQQADLKDFVKVVDRGLQDADAVIAFKPDHATRTQVDQRFTNRSPRYPEACGKLAHRMEASRQQIAGSDCIAKYFGDLLLQTYLLSDRAEGAQAGFRSVRPSPGDFFQGALIVAQGLLLDHPRLLMVGHESR